MLAVTGPHHGRFHLDHLLNVRFDRVVVPRTGVRRHDLPIGDVRLLVLVPVAPLVPG